MSNTNNHRLVQADEIIKKHTIWSSGIGLLPIPGVDFLGVTAVQLDMIHQLCTLYEKDYYEARGKAIISALAGASVARIGSSLIKTLPFVGSVLGGISSAVLSGATTYALGEVIKEHFESGGTIFNLKVEDFKAFYEEQLEKGKKMAKEWQEEVTQEKQDSASPPEEEPLKTDDTTTEAEPSLSLDKLKELAELKDAGVLSEEEFQAMKARLIDEYFNKQ